MGMRHHFGAGVHRLEVKPAGTEKAADNGGNSDLEMMLWADSTLLRHLRR